MKLTQENKSKIDSLNVFSLLNMVRNHPVGDPWFQGETGTYILNKLEEKRAENPAAYVSASKALSN